jgi:anti-sigma regulatory factor (Ser/Thr protein kinase)
VGRLTHSPEQESSQPAPNIVTVTGRHRLPTDVVGELLGVLGEEPRIVVCDMTRMAPAASAMPELFGPVMAYLRSWPGTVVVVCVPDPSAHARMLPAAVAGRLLIHADADEGVAEARRLLRPLVRAEKQLMPTMTAARDARQFLTRTLLDWELPGLIAPGSLVVSELVTNSVVHAMTVLVLTLSRIDDRVRVGVSDHGGGAPAVGPSEGQLLHGRGLLLVQACTCSWGVLPVRGQGKMVWAVLDSEEAPASRDHRRATAMN